MAINPHLRSKFDLSFIMCSNRPSNQFYLEGNKKEKENGVKEGKRYRKRCRRSGEQEDKGEKKKRREKEKKRRKKP